jgi:hypothetical protein
MSVPATSRLFVLAQGELAFLQKVTRAEYYFITDDEQASRQSLRDKLNEVVFDARKNRIAVNLTPAEITFLAHVVNENLSFITESEKKARQALHERLAAAI